MLFYRIFSKIYRFYARKVCIDCSDFIKIGSEILDLGCGSGITSDTFAKFFSAKVTGVDIADRRIVPIDFRLYDGKNLPFKNDNFDVVLINYVLHHCRDPLYTLKEAKRVTKDKIIVNEDLPENFFLRLVCKIHGITFALFFQKNEKLGNFKNDDEWKKIFEDLGLKLIFEKKESLRRKIFVLQKGD